MPLSDRRLKALYECFVPGELYVLSEDRRGGIGGVTVFSWSEEKNMPGQLLMPVKHLTTEPMLFLKFGQVLRPARRFLIFLENQRCIALPADPIFKWTILPAKNGVQTT